ncbi:MAG: hypothetical protein ABW192_03885 [Sphingobium sp.]
MRAAPAILALTLLAGAQDAAIAAPDRVIRCGPPLDAVLRLVVTQHMWLEDGKPATVVITRDLRFVQDGRGYAVEAAISALDTDQNRPERGGISPRDRLLLAYGSPGAVRIRIRLDTAMAIAGVDSLDSLWLDFRRRQTHLDAAMARGGKGNPRTSAMLRALEKTTDAQRVAILTGFLAPLLRHCGTVAPAGATPMPDGAVALETRSDAGGISDVAQYIVDGRTGLLRSLDRLIVTAEAPLRPLREEWTLRLAPEQKP